MGVVAVELECGTELPTVEVEYDTLSSIAKEEGMMPVGSHPLE